MDHLGDLSHQFDLKGAAGTGVECYVIDQRADDLNRFGPRRVVAEQVVEVCDLLQVDFGEVRMEPHRLMLKTGKFRSYFVLAQFQRVQLGLNAWTL
jgi:hypothetical protein